MTHCQYARDEADENSLSGFDQFLKTPGSKELSLSSPMRQSSIFLSGWPLRSIEEERGDEADLLSCLQESTVLLQGATPQDVHAYVVKYRLLKSSLATVQLMLIDYPQFATGKKA